MQNMSRCYKLSFSFFMPLINLNDEDRMQPCLLKKNLNTTSDIDENATSRNIIESLFISFLTPIQKREENFKAANCP